MSDHVSDVVPRLLTGDATRDETLAAAAHLRTCVDCQQELVAAVVAHAALTSAHRFAPSVVTRPVRAEEDADVDAEATDDAPLPDLSAMFAQVRAEAARPRPPRRRALLAGAAAVVLVGAGVGSYAAVSSGSNQPAGRSIALAAFGSGRVPARVTVVDNNMRVDAAALPRLAPQYQYEVWLTNTARTKMQSVGFIAGDNNRAILPVSPDLMARYSNIEVSVQRSDQAAYSGRSVLRGDYG